jgi:hypothetical protein
MEWIDSTVERVAQLLDRKPDDSPTDIYVWSDGSVTGPKDNDSSRVSGLRVVSVFTPGEPATEQQIRTSIENGLVAAEEAAEDDPHTET